MSWQLQDAKQRFSEVVRQAIEDGPQVVTRHGEEVVVVVSMDQFRRWRGEVPDFKEYLRAAPDLSPLSLRRDRRPARRVKL